MKFILGKKLNMDQVFLPDGTVVPVTKVAAGPCLVMQKRTQETDGYTAVACAYHDSKNVTKSLRGIFKKFGDKNYRYVREFRMKADDEMYDKLNPGDVLTADLFGTGDRITVVGTSKGKGFQGVVKRHGFAGGKKSHGHKDQLRMPGSIGSTGPARVFKGTRMGGRMGGDSVTVTGLEIIAIDVENNLLYIKGALPGARNGLLLISGEGSFEVKAPVVETVAEPAKAKEASKKAEPTDKKVEKTADEKSNEPAKEEKKTEAPVREEKAADVAVEPNKKDAETK